MSTYAIKCPSCAGSLNVLGGRQIVTITCEYCGSVLDMQNEYKLLSKFSKASKNSLPKSPFTIGMSGKIKDIEFTIIGLVAYSTTKNTKNIKNSKNVWIDYMLYSPTHGYAWLSYENGGATFSYRTRDFFENKMSDLDIFDEFEFDDHTYEYYEYYKAYVRFVQGELTWIAKKNDFVDVYEAISPPLGLSFEKHKQETEAYISSYLDIDEVYESFNIEYKKNGFRVLKCEDFHPLKPFSELISAHVSMSLLFVKISLGILVVLFLFTSFSLKYFAMLFAFFLVNFFISFIPYNSYQDELWKHYDDE